MPPGFSWIEQPKLAALAYPYSADDLRWLRQAGIEVVMTLTEEPLPKTWINEAGLMSVHIPIPDMDVPTQSQLTHAIESIHSAHHAGLGVAVHCAAGRGRTGTILAGYLVTQGYRAAEAIGKIREMRPGSVETYEQERVIEQYAEELRQLD